MKENTYVSGGHSGVWKDSPRPKDPNISYDDGYDLVRVTGEEATAMLALMVEHGYMNVKGPQIGFVGTQQVFDPPIQL